MEAKRQFHAGSWLLTHYLLEGAPVLGDGIPDYLNEAGQGRPGRDGFESAFRIAVPAPPGDWDVTIWGVPDAEAERASLSQLSAGPGGWYYQSSTGLIHLRFTKDHRGGVIE